jgi:lysophospholipid acyltransferase (LPLAT)-like uncharacterized protein
VKSDLELLKHMSTFLIPSMAERRGSSINSTSPKKLLPLPFSRITVVFGEPITVSESNLERESRTRLSLVTQDHEYESVDC